MSNLSLPTEAPASGRPSAASPDDLTYGQLAEEVNACLQAGREPDVEALAARYPHLAGQIRELVAALLALRQLTPEGLVPASADRPLVPDAAVLGCLGDFQILREVGRGGMGVVYEALQISLGRRVALKVLPFASTLDAKQLQRFKNEAQAAAHLHHTGIVPVYATGCERGVHYYAMQFIEGQTLAAMIQELRQRPAGGHQVHSTQHLVVGTSSSATAAAVRPEQSNKSPEFFRTVACLGIQAAEALEHAHQLAVVHRDIKPANLLVDLRGNLWITDFGLAHCQSQAGLTMTGDLVGTLRYMSPEQALAKRLSVDHRADVYSLGATLYELLTLEPAFDGCDREELRRQIAVEEPRSLRQLNSSIPVELETIVLKAMEKNPAERYATAWELAEDLHRYVEDKPILAKRPSVRQRLAKWSRRHRTVVWAALILLVMAAVGFAVSTVVVLHQRDLAREQEEEAGRERARALNSLYHSLVGEVRALRLARVNGYRQQAWLRLQEALALDTPERNADQLRQEAVACLGDFVGLEPITWQDLGAEVIAIALSPDGRLVAISLGNDTVAVRNVRTGAEIARLPEPAAALAFEPCGDRLVTAKRNGTIKVWQAGANGEWSWTPKVTTAGSAVAMTADGKQAAIFSRDEEGTLISLWNVKDAGIAARCRIRPEDRVTHDADQRLLGQVLSSDGKLLAAELFREGKYGLCVWDVANHQLRFSVADRFDRAAPFNFSFDGKFLACRHGDDALALFETRSLRQPFLIRSDSVHDACFSPDHQWLAFVTITGTVKLWSMSLNRALASLEHPHGQWARFVRFSADGTVLATAGARSVRIWNLAGSGEKRVLAGHGGGVPCVAFSPDGKLLASGSKDRTVRLWDASTGQPLRTLPRFDGFVQALAFSPDGQLLATGDWAGGLKIWDAKSLQVLAAPDHGLGTELNAVAFSPDGNYLAASGEGLTIWRISRDQRDPVKPPRFSLKRARHLRGRRSQCLRISPDSKLLAWEDNGGVWLWDLEKGREIPFPGPLVELGWHNLAFYPDGRHLTYVSSASRAEVWDLTARQRLFSFGRPGEFQARYIALSPDGRWFAGVPSATQVTLWHAQNGKRFFSLPEERGPVWSLAWSPDRERLAVGLADGGLAIWDLPQVSAQLAQLSLDWEGPDGFSEAAQVREAGAETPAIKEQLETEVPAEPLAPDQIAWGYLDQGRRLIQYRPEGAELALLQALPLYERLVAEATTQADYWAGLASTYHELAAALTKTGRGPEAEKACRRARDLYEKLVADFPDKRGYRAKLAVTYRMLGLLLQAGGQLLQAEKAFRQAVRLGEELVAGSTVRVYRQDLASSEFTLGKLLEATRRYAEAEKAYRRAPELLPDDPRAANDLAWFLATCPDPQVRNPLRAVEQAKKAVKLAPEQGNCWNTLGVACYRAGDWKAAITALEKSRQLRQGGDSSDWFVLAMAHWQLGNKDQARSWYDRAVKGMEKHQPENGDRHHLRAEAAAVLGMETKKN